MDIQSVRKFALSLPETSEAPHFNFGSFRVRGKIFVTVPPEDGYIHVFVDEQERLLALAMYPGAIEPLHWGQKTVGVRVNLRKANAAAVRHLVNAAWKTKAPKRLWNVIQDLPPSAFGTFPRKRGKG